MKSLTRFKSDFPVLTNNPGLVYLDSAATSLKPQPVIDAIRDYYENCSASVHRGIYGLSEKATEEFEDSRELVARFINAPNTAEIVFTRNATESINLLAYSLGRKIVDDGDEIVVSVMEHHSNFVPWQQLAFEVGATFKVIDITSDGYLDLPLEKIKNQKSKIPLRPRSEASKTTNQNLKLQNIITDKTKILALTLVSNVSGTVNPIKEIIAAAKKINPRLIVIIDAAQAVPHMPVDVQDLAADFLVFSGHKMLGPTGIGVLWGKYDLLCGMFPFNFGGGMIADVAIEQTKFMLPSGKFEAGTPAIAEAIGLGEAVKYLSAAGMANVAQHEKDLVGYALKRLVDAFGNDIKVLGPSDRIGVIAFTFKNYHPHDIAQILDEENICVRAGHHCAMPLHKRLGLAASTRMSFHVYNDYRDIDRAIEGLKKVKSVLK